MQTRVIGVVAIVVTAGISAVVACGDSSTPVTGCTPGTTISCTGSGLCSGTQVCKSDRTYDACTCADAGVVDSGPDSPPIVDAGPDVDPFDPTPLAWAKLVNLDFVNALAVTSTHDILVGGSGGQWNVLAKYDAKGALLWEKTFPDKNFSARASVLLIAPEPSGNIYVLLDSPANIDYGDGTIAQAGRVLLKLDASGKFVWRYGALPIQANFHQMKARPNGNVVLVGELDGDVDFGAGTVSLNGSSDALVVRRWRVVFEQRERVRGEVGSWNAPLNWADSL